VRFRGGREAACRRLGVASHCEIDVLQRAAEEQVAHRAAHEPRVFAERVARQAQYLEALEQLLRRVHVPDVEPPRWCVRTTRADSPQVTS
jgi:hypothetical protein